MASPYRTPLYTELIAYSDGGNAEGNPGRGYCGAVLTTPTGVIVASRARHLGKGITNNVAEYHGVLCALDLIHAFAPERALLRSDSQIVVNQLNRVWAVMNAALLELWIQADEALHSLHGRATIEWIPRTKNPADHICVQLRNWKSEDEAEGCLPAGERIERYLYGKRARA